MRIYLDHNATTRVDPRVLEHFVAVESSCPGNASSVHTSGRQARAVVEEARRTIARCLAVDDQEVVFVSGGTEANNMVVLGLGDATRPVLASAAEHASVLEPARRRGYIQLPVDASGRVCWLAGDGEVAGSSPPPGLVCAVHGQSEVGTLNDLAAARRAADALGAPLHVDASQSLGRVDLRPALANADTIALSLHKAGGLKGVGILVVRRRAPQLRALLAGGGQERGLRPGSVSPALAASAAVALSLAIAEQPERAAAMRGARDAFWETLSSVHDVQRITPVEGCLPNTLMLLFRAVPDGRMLLPALDLAGIEASHGAACASGSPLPPPVLRAMGYRDEDARRCVRFSFSHVAMRDAAQEAAHRVQQVVDRLARA